MDTADLTNDLYGMFGTASRYANPTPGPSRSIREGSISKRISRYSIGFPHTNRPRQSLRLIATGRVDTDRRGTEGVGSDVQIYPQVAADKLVGATL